MKCEVCGNWPARYVRVWPAEATKCLCDECLKTAQAERIAAEERAQDLAMMDQGLHFTAHLDNEPVHFRLFTWMSVVGKSFVLRESDRRFLEQGRDGAPGEHDPDEFAVPALAHLEVGLRCACGEAIQPKSRLHHIFQQKCEQGRLGGAPVDPLVAHRALAILLCHFAGVLEAEAATTEAAPALLDEDEGA